MTSPLTVRCSRCPHIWRSDVHGLVELFNHPELHRWTDAGFDGKANFTIRQGQPNPYKALSQWVYLELLPMGVSPERAVYAAAKILISDPHWVPMPPLVEPVLQEFGHNIKITIEGYPQ